MVGRVDQGILTRFYPISNFEFTIFRQTIGYPDLEISRETAGTICTLCVQSDFLIRYQLHAKQSAVPTRRSTVVAVGTIIGFQVIGLSIEFKASSCNPACYRANTSPIFRAIAHIVLKTIKA